MEWIRAHPYASAIVAAVLVIAGGVFIVDRHSPVSPSQTITWSGGPAAGSYSSTSTAPEGSSGSLIVQNHATTTYVLPNLSTSTNSVTPTSNSYDYMQLLNELSTARATSISGPSGNSTIAQAYQFIPTGLIATNAPTKKSLTASQQAIYDYGNLAGGEIKSFETLHTNQAGILKDQAEDRTDPLKSAALVSLGEALASVGTYLQTMQNVPDAAKPLNSALAGSYLDIGAKLQLVAKTQTDDQFIQAVQTYDKAADVFVKNYTALAGFFSVQGVTFSQQDGGSVFSFQGQAL